MLFEEENLYYCRTSDNIARVRVGNVQHREDNSIEEILRMTSPMNYVVDGKVPKGNSDWISPYLCNVHCRV